MFFGAELKRKTYREREEPHPMIPRGTTVRRAAKDEVERTNKQTKVSFSSSFHDLQNSANSRMASPIRLTDWELVSR